MVKPTSQLELNTLRVSNETKQSIRKPFIWEKPTPRLYDYHYEANGLYYQPMLQYISSLEEGGPRRPVDIPDRILADFDRRAYALNTEPVNLEKFLTETYKKRIKEINQQLVYVENEKARRSRKTSTLNMVRGAAVIRDRYLSKLQLHQTGEEAKRQRETGAPAFGFDEEVALFLENKKKPDLRYEPGFHKVSSLDAIQKYTARQLEDSQILEERSRQEEERLAYIREKNYLDTLAEATKQVMAVKESARTIIRRTADGQEIVVSTGDEGKVPFGLEAALAEVRSKVIAATVQPQDNKLKKPQELDITLGGRPFDQLGCNERAHLWSEQFRHRALPNIDVGYETVVNNFTI